MTGVLVDTSVWVDHFRLHNDDLAALLERDMVRMHPMILGELACGTPPARARTLADFEGLQQTQQASVREVMDFVERERLYGLGCGLVDMILLASTLMTPGIELWTLDKRLFTLTQRFKVTYRSAQH
jgi:hypothetical protein